MKGAMVSVATGAMNSVLDKLTTLLGKEFSGGVKQDIALLKDELSCMNALLEKMADMDLMDPQMKDWRNQVREMAYDIEDCIDGYMLQQRHTGVMGFFRDYVHKVVDLVNSHHGVAQQIKELKGRIVEASHRRKRYKLDTEVESAGTTSSIDPRLPSLYVESSDLVGIDIPRENLINFLDDGELSLKVISIVGFGGLGKTTLAKEAYKKLCVKFNCHALVSVSQKPDVKKILWSILSQVKSANYANTMTGDEECLIDALRAFLKDKRCTLSLCFILQFISAQDVYFYYIVVYTALYYSSFSRYFIIIDDIWDTQVWNIIKCALLENACGSRIIVTTRIASIAKSCSCSHHHGTVYELTPLREADSKILFYKRTFGSEDSYPINLRAIANEIIKRCGGMPLAIITMACLMTTKSNRIEEWVNVHSLMGLGLQNYNVEGMERILSLSYNDLPYHLKTCLLYLSMYPEDSEIDMHQLVRRWMAEGFINIKSGTSSFAEEGECYFNELINRRLIQPAHIGLDGQVTSCRVHDMILDLIISKAVEENFITFTGDQAYMLASNKKIRRLSVDYRGNENIMSSYYSSMICSHVRSLCILGYSQKMLPISNFQALRILDLETSVKLENCYLQRIGDLLQLRYLRIAASNITHLPEQIGELKFLETLDLRRTWIRKLPPSTIKLQRLNFLYVNGSQLLDGIGKMQSLKELSGVSLYDACSIDSMRELGNLTNLKTLGLTWHISGARSDRADILASSLGELVSSSLRHLRIVRGPGSVDIPLDSWFAPPHVLRKLDIPGCCFQRIPEWMASMVNLFRLSIRFKQVTQEILHTLGNLHSLLDLELRSSEAAHDPMEMLILCNSRFQCLKIFRLYGPTMGLKFEAGAVPQLEQLSIEIRAHHIQYELLANNSADLGIHHLTSLRDLNVWINCDGAKMEEVQVLEASITGATNVLPNKPTPHFYRENQDNMVSHR
jgi:hypothetical protein